MGAACYKPRNSESYIWWGGRDRKNDLSLSSLSESHINKFLCHDMNLSDTDELELCGIPLQAREVAQFLSFAYQPDDVLYILSRLSKTSLSFLSKNRVEIIEVWRESDQKLKIEEIKMIEEHEAGVNQIIHLNNNELATASHDFSIKVWDKKKLKCTQTIQTETCNCFWTTGFRGKYLMTGYPNGDIFVYNSRKKNKLGTVSNAHHHLIRSMFSLNRLMHSYFVSIDVWGLIKVWQSLPQPKEAMEINMDSGIAYNSTIELTSLLPHDKTGILVETAAIAWALKSWVIHIILIDPIENFHKIYKILEISQKPSSMVELNGGLLGVGIGSLQSPSKIEIWSYVHGTKIGVINAHDDMIDSMIMLNTGFQSEIRANIKSAISSHVPFFQSTLLTSGRDKKLKIFKIYPGSKDDESYWIWEFDWQHTDYVRSLLQIDHESFASASEDKSIRFYSLQH
jgi:WD40 repeat protein